MRGERSLRDHRRTQSRIGSGEDEEEGVTLRIDLATVVGCCGLAQKRLVLS
jgi:hypothetical protein